jgi:hypothetical protein
MIKKFSYVLLCVLFFGCHSTKWSSLNNYGSDSAAPEKIQNVFKKHKDNIITISAISPGSNYKYDIGEKDSFYSDSSSFNFTKVKFALHNKMPKGKIITDISFFDENNNMVLVPNVDLLRFIPKFDAIGDVIYPEIIEEEFNRFGYTFRKEHNEFKIKIAEPKSGALNDVKNRAYRCQIVNNCLAATKWEFSLTSEDYSDFNTRLKSTENLNQNKILSHSWFYFDMELYTELIHLKNPKFNADFKMPYDDLSNKAEQVTIDFSKLRRPIKYRANTKILELGHKTKRQIEPLDNEQFYKKQFKLVIDGQTNDYASILESPIKTTQFKDEGFYTTTTPKEFDLNWMKHLDSVHIDIVDIKGTNAYVELTLTGEWSPYKINIGNIDLAQLSEQKLYGVLFGINTYPKSRRYNPMQSTISYDADLLPNDIKPYLWLTKKDNNKWVNNQYKGIEKVYLTYDTMEQDVLSVYVLSYERITPVWMARIKLPKDIREKIRIRNKLYNY